MSTATERPRLADFWHDLPREGQMLLTVIAFEFIGTGLVLPFYVVYLHEVREFALNDVGVLLAVMSLAGFLTWGRAACDRPVRGAGVVIARCGAVVRANHPRVRRHPDDGGFRRRPQRYRVRDRLADLAEPDRLGDATDMRERYFGINFSLLNLGIGIGGIIGGLLVDVDLHHLPSHLSRGRSELPPIDPPPAGPAAARRRPGSARPRPMTRYPVTYLTVLREPAMGALTVMTSSRRSSATRSSTPACRRTRVRSVRSRPGAWAFAFAATPS